MKPYDYDKIMSNPVEKISKFWKQYYLARDRELLYGIPIPSDEELWKIVDEDWSKVDE